MAHEFMNLTIGLFCLLHGENFSRSPSLGLLDFLGLLIIAFLVGVLFLGSTFVIYIDDSNFKILAMASS